MRLSRQLQACLFIYSFFYRKISLVQNTQRHKTSDFHPLRKFERAKNCCLCCLVVPYFCFVGSFFLVTCFCAREIFL